MATFDSLCSFLVQSDFSSLRVTYSPVVCKCEVVDQLDDNKNFNRICIGVVIIVKGDKKIEIFRFEITWSIERARLK